MNWRREDKEWLMMKCKGAIFDMDGLLFDTEKLFQQTWNEIAEERGIQLPKEFSGEISGTNGKHMCRVIEKYYKISDGREIQDECMLRVQAKLKRNVPKKPGVDEILQYFKKNKIPLAVASSSSKQLIESNLRVARVSAYFDVIVSGTEVKHGKPAPDIFLIAAERIKCRPEECYVFEDSVNGVRAGVAAGCKTVMIPDLILPTREEYKCCYGIYDTLKDAVMSFL